MSDLRTDGPFPGPEPIARLSRDELVEWFAKAMAYRGVGDPNATDRNGEPRWKWYRDEAERFVTTYSYLLLK